MFQSPERIHAFGNSQPPSTQSRQRCFNPQRGFMLLGTSGHGSFREGYYKFQSPERIHAFGNSLMMRWWSLERSRFNPQRGFMLLGTCPRPQNMMLHGMFQSPERIHAFGNHSRSRSLTDKRKFQSPERIHAFGNNA